MRAALRWLRALLTRRRPISVLPLSEAKFDPELERLVGGFSEHRREKREEEEI